MKYVLKILFISFAAFFIFLWELLVLLWSFRTHRIKEEWNEYYGFLVREYRAMCRAFRY